MPRFELPPRPRPGGQLFQSAEDCWHNAVLSEYQTSWYTYAEGYKRAAEAVIDHVAATRMMQDALVYPVLFLYRQYLELTLKILIADAEELAQIDGPPARGHDLNALWARCKQAVVRVMRELDDHSVDLSIIANCVLQFQEADPSAQGFRYPEHHDGSPIRHAASHVNLRHLRDEMDNAGRVLDALLTGFSVYVDQRREMLYEMGP